MAASYKANFMTWLRAFAGAQSHTDAFNERWDPAWRVAEGHNFLKDALRLFEHPGVLPRFAPKPNG